MCSLLSPSALISNSGLFLDAIVIHFFITVDLVSGFVTANVAHDGKIDWLEVSAF